MRVAVTGGTGFVGAHSVRALLDAGHEVRLLARSAEVAASTLTPLGVTPDRYELVLGDVCRPADVARLLEGSEALLHAAGVVGVDDRLEGLMWQVNVQGTATALSSAVARGLDPVVHVASYSALFPAPGELIGPDSPTVDGRSAYARTKAAGDRIARGFQDASAPVVITYPSGIVGPPAGPRVGLAAEGWAPLLRFGVSISFDGAMAIVDVRDVAELHARLMQPGHGPRRIVAGGEMVPFDEVVDVLAEASGRRVRRVRLSPRSVLRIGRAVDALSKILPVPPVLTYEAAWILTTAQATDDSRALELLGRDWRSARSALRDAVAGARGVADGANR